MAKFDAERLVDRIQSFLQDNLSAKLTEITADFAAEDAAAGRVIVLENVPNEGYFLNTIIPSPNINPIIIIVLDSVTPTSAGTLSAKQYVFSIILGHAGLKNDLWDNIQRKLARYTRAIEEVLMEKFAQLMGHSQVKLNGITFNQEIEIKQGQVLRVNGLNFTATIA